jgi:hypothetical protein
MVCLKYRMVIKSVTFTKLCTKKKTFLMPFLSPSSQQLGYYSKPATIHSIQFTLPIHKSHKEEIMRYTMLQFK